MQIRRAEKKDAVQWAAMRQRLWPDAGAAELSAETRAFLDGRTVAAIAAVLVAVEGEALRGFVEIGVRPFADGCISQPVPHVEGWYVEPSARGRGLGRALLEAAEAWAKARGFDEIASDSEIENHASIAAHGACGYVETERLVKFRKAL